MIQSRLTAFCKLVIFLVEMTLSENFTYGLQNVTLMISKVRRKSVEFLSQPARLQTTTLRYNKGLVRRDEKRRSLIFSSRALIRPRAWVSRASNFGPFAMTGVVVIGSWQRKIRD